MVYAVAYSRAGGLTVLTVFLLPLLLLLLPLLSSDTRLGPPPSGRLKLVTTSIYLNFLYAKSQNALEKKKSEKQYEEDNWWSSSGARVGESKAAGHSRRS